MAPFCFGYTAFDKPSRISKGSNYTDFAYGPDRQLYRRTDVRNSQTTDSFYIDGLYERVTLPSGVIEHKFYVGNAVITKRSNNAHDELYLHKDNQGSTISISNSAGTVLQQFIYDPWGRQDGVMTLASEEDRGKNSNLALQFLHSKLSKVKI